MTKAKVARKAARRPRQPELQRVYSSSMYTAHMMNDSRIFGSEKNSGPYFSIASTEPAIRPKRHEREAEEQRVVADVVDGLQRRQPGQHAVGRFDFSARSCTR